MLQPGKPLEIWREIESFGEIQLSGFIEDHRGLADRRVDIRQLLDVSGAVARLRNHHLLLEIFEH
jgi:hypothetical protein